MYLWDARNRLVGISGYKPDCSPLSASFKYDALGRRIEKTINGTTIQYVYDRYDIIQEIQGGAKTNYIRTLRIDEPLTRIESDGTVRHYVRDALGSIIGLTDDSGQLAIVYNYDPFGNVTITGEVSDNPFQYTGRENDGTGLYYYRARYYSPELQRFISEDPIGLRGGVNFHAYVGNNPVNKIDPTGLVGIDSLITFILKRIGSKVGGTIVDSGDIDSSAEGDTDNDGVPNFLDPDYPPNQPCIQCHTGDRLPQGPRCESR